MTLRWRASQAMRLATTSSVLATWDGSSPRLQPFEADRAHTFRRDSDREDFIAAHLLARLVVGELLAVPPCTVVVTQSCDVCGGRDHGRPAVVVAGQPPVHASWSHTHGVVAAAASFTPIGVDVERTDRLLSFLTSSDAFLATAERRRVEESLDKGAALGHWWTMKEALVKVGATDIDSFEHINLAPTPHRFEQWRTASQVDRTLGAVVSVATLASGITDGTRCALCRELAHSEPGIQPPNHSERIFRRAN